MTSQPQPAPVGCFPVCVLALDACVAYFGGAVVSEYGLGWVASAALWAFVILLAVAALVMWVNPEGCDLSQPVPESHDRLREIDAGKRFEISRLVEGSPRWIVANQQYIAWREGVKVNRNGYWESEK